MHRVLIIDHILISNNTNDRTFHRLPLSCPDIITGRKE